MSKLLRQKGSWLPITVGLILGALLIRYASSSEWWQNQFNPGKGFKTVNTGVSVQVSDVGTPILPGNPPTPTDPVNPVSPSPTRPPNRMW